MKRAIVVFSALVIVFAGLLSHQLGYIQAGSGVSTDTSDTGYEYYDGEGLDNEDSDMASSTLEPRKASPLIEVDTKEDSITVLVNREYRLSEDYIPADLVVPEVRFSYYGTYEKSYVRQVTADALEKLFAAGEKKGVILKAVSGYRSYARQKEIYNRNVNSRGVTKTDLVSAKPGASEHQTGLSIDVSSETVGCALEESFGATADGKWLARNCHKYGFIIRYPKNKTNITGYSYEPWHIRYVGRKLATYLYQKGLTLEEYYQTTTVDEQITEPEGKIHDVAEDEKDEPEMKTAPTPKPDHKISSTQRSTQEATPTKTPSASKPKKTKKPAPTKKPVSKPTKKPVAKTPAPSQEDTTEQDGTEPAATPDNAGQSTPAGDSSVATTEENTSAQSENTDEEIDLDTK